MGFCNEIIPNCDVCWEVAIGDCLTSITLSLGLSPSTTYYLRLINKWDTEYDITGITNGSGDLPIDKTQLPNNLINEYAGDFELQIFGNSARTTLVMITQGLIQYDCVILTQALTGQNLLNS